MNSLFAILSVLICVANAHKYLTANDVLLQEWEEFKARYNKSYKDQSTENFRLKIYMENKHQINLHNTLAVQKKKSYHLEMNSFGDLLPNEYTTLMLGYKLQLSRAVYASATFQRSNASTFIAPENFVMPRQVNWVQQGFVTPVKNQGQCGSCWAFSATGSLEGQHYRKTRKLVSLSEQNLVDCSTSYDNHGCNGGLMDNAFNYIRDNGGIDTEESYRYRAKEGTCRFRRDNVGAIVTGYVNIPSGDEVALAKAVASVGPVSVAIDASHQSFQFYSHGVYDEEGCSSTELDHGVLVVGYGESREMFNNKKYWLIKNSWGERWGDKGYIKIARGKNNLCGVATQASYPLV